MGLAVFSVSYWGFVSAADPPIIITILKDGAIEPPTAPISRSENTYTLTGNITNCRLDILCNNITLDGKDYTLNVQIHIGGDFVTVKNLNIEEDGDIAILIEGSYNVVENNVLNHNYGGITIVGGYNTITGNTIINGRYPTIVVTGDYNTITQNYLMAIYMDSNGSNNIITENTLDFITGNGENNTCINNVLDSYPTPTSTPLAELSSGYLVVIVPIVTIAVCILLVIFISSEKKNPATIRSAG